MAGADAGYMRPPLVLIVTGHEWLSLSIESVFASRGYAVLRAFTGAQAAQQLTVPVDLLILDRDLRDITGLELARRLRDQGVIGPATPVVLIAADPWPRDDKLAALRAGVWDVASLPWDSEELFLRMDSWVRAKLSGEAQRDSGLVDPHTGFYNAEGVLRRLGELAAAAARHRRPLGVVVLTAGRGAAPAGDGVGARGGSDTVRRFAEMLRGVQRASDAIGRLSDRQFVIVAPDTGEEGVIHLAERLQAALAALSELGDGARALNFGCYAVPDFRDAAVTPTELLMRAAAALRESESGSRSIQFFNPGGAPN